METVVYCCIARGSLILVDYSNSPLTSQTVVPILETILKQISSSQTQKHHQIVDGLSYNVLMDKGIAFCMVNAKLLPDSTTLSVLNEVQQKFFESPDLILQAQLSNVQVLSVLFGEKLKEIVQRRIVGRTSRVEQLQSQVNDVRQIMIQNVEQLLERGDRLEDLLDKSSDLESSSSQFRNNAQKIRRQLCCKNAKWTIICIVTIIIVLLTIVLLILHYSGVF